MAHKNSYNKWTEAELNSIVCDVPRIDWLTATTFDQVHFMSIRDEWMRWTVRSMTGGKSEQAKRRQYKGVEIGGVFFGIAEQNGVDHFMVVASGGLAHHFATIMRTWLAAMKVTRIDIQYTTSLMGNWDLNGDAEQMHRLSPATTTTTYVKRSAKGKYQTLYVGSRQSDKMVRVYQKDGIVDGGHEVKLGRWEIEFTGDLAPNVYSSVFADPENSAKVMGGILSTSYDKLEGRFGRLTFMGTFSPMLKYDTYKLRVMGKPSRTVEWLYEAVLPAIKSLCAEGSSEQAMVWLNVARCSVGDVE